MAKIIEGIALIVSAAVLTFYIGPAAWVLAVAAFGASQLLEGIAQALQGGQSSPFSVRAAAAPRQAIYGQARVAGTIVYMSTSGSNLNQVVVWAGHACESVQTVYLDSRATHIPSGGGNDTGGTYTDDNGNNYSFGSLVSIYHTLGAGSWFWALNAQDSRWDTSCTLTGLTASYVRCSYDVNTFASQPGIKATIYGKNNIYDPRTGVTGYTNNAALVIADFLCSSDFGIGANFSTEIDEDQLIAAANICDEQVALAAGGYESRYTINGWFDTSSTPGEILDAMLTSCEGRISYSGGVWKIFPAAWYPSGLTFDANDFTGPIRYQPSRKYRDLSNAVRATYISPRYPYAVVGYDQDHKDTGIFSGEWQLTDMPEYAQDSQHGYSTDANLTQDGNVKLYANRNYRFVTSVSMAQRLAKIYLLRNRFQGTGTVQMSLAAYQCLAQDVIQLSFPALSWVLSYFEVTSIRLVPKFDSQGQEPPSIYCELDIAQTDPSVYEWSNAEELGVQDQTSPTIADAHQILPPTSLTITSGAATALVAIDGIVTPRILATWVDPVDPFVLSGGHIEIQYEIAGSGAWVEVAMVNAGVEAQYMPCVAGEVYNVQIRSRRANGNTSNWVQAGPLTAGITLSAVSHSYGYNSVSNYGFEQYNSNNGLADQWNIFEMDIPANWLVQREVSSGGAHSGSCNLLIRILPNSVFSAGTNAVRVFSDYIPISGGEPIYYGGYWSWASTAGIPAGLTVIQRIGLYFWDVNKNFISETTIDYYGPAAGLTMTEVSNTANCPSNASYMILECCVFAICSSPVTVPNQFIADCRFDDVFAGQQFKSGMLNSQGSIIPSEVCDIPYSVTNNSVNFSWSAQSILRSDGQSIAIAAGSLSYSGLSASTTYYTYWYADISSGTFQVTNGSPPPTSPNNNMAAQMGLDGRIPIEPISFTTTASGTGIGKGGGDGTCPEAAELVEVRGRGQIRADAVRSGDYIKGYSFRAKQDVYRRVIHTRTQGCAAWRMLEGYRVSPCEAVYYEDQWQAAYKASGVVDTMIGTKILISVDGGEDREHNYYLAGQEKPLLIHNFMLLPC